MGLIDDAGLPRVLPITYAVLGDFVVTAVDHKRKNVPAERLARVRWLSRRPKATITVDHYDDDWSRLAWVQMIGSVRTVEVDAQLLAALAARYHQYEARPPDGPLLVLAAERLVWWRA